jgi:thiol:disulfide interchange protein DsbC
MAGIFGGTIMKMTMKEGEIEEVLDGIENIKSLSESIGIAVLAPQYGVDEMAPQSLYRLINQIGAFCEHARSILVQAKEEEMKTTIITAMVLFLVLLFCGPAQAQANLFGSIKAVKAIPIQGVKIIESDKGVFFVSENGRFAWKGPLYDMWNGKEVRTLEDADTVVNHVDIKKIGIDPNQLATLTIGQGETEEVIFVSPDCPHCRKMLQQAVTLGDKYRFKVVLVPMDQKSMEHTKQILCTKDKDAAVKALVSGNFESLASADCGPDLVPLQRTLVAARILGLQSVPLMFRHDGKVQSGELRDLAGWLEGKNDKADRALGALPTKESPEAKK